MANLKSIDQPLPLAKIAYRSLRDSILTGRLQPGEMYNEMALAKDLGISRTPVREALLELASQGLVTFLPRRGVLINRFTERDVEEIFEVRAAIELALVEKLAKAETPPDLRGVEKALELQGRAVEEEDTLAFLEADRAFHVAFSEMANNRRFVAILGNVRDLIQMMSVEALTREGRVDEVIGEHREVLKAIRARQPRKAREAMAAHLERSKEAVLEQHCAGA